MNDRPLTLVLGATGKTGRRVVSRLAEAGWPVRAGSRRAVPAFDWHAPEGWDAVLDGVAQVYVTYQPDLAVPGAVDAISRFVDRAEAAGVRRVVLLSGRGEPAAQACEQVVQGSGMAHTIVRASFFAQNFSEGPFADAVASGVFAMPTRGVREPFIDIEDLADVVVAALTEVGHEGQVYEVTGPRMLDFPEALAEIAAANGAPIRFVEVSPDAYAEGLRAAGLPPEEAAFYTELFSEVLDGRNAYVTDGVARALGRPATDFADFVNTAAAAGAWGPR